MPWDERGEGERKGGRERERTSGHVRKALRRRERESGKGEGERERERDQSSERRKRRWPS